MNNLSRLVHLDGLANLTDECLDIFHISAALAHIRQISDKSEKDIAAEIFAKIQIMITCA